MPPLAAFVAALVLVGAPNAMAASSVTVSTQTDVVNASDGLCSLREAITAANTNNASGLMFGECPAGLTGGTIHVPDGPNNTGGTYVLTGGELHITAPVTITGTANHPTVVSNGTDRVFEVSNGVSASISGLEIAGGKAASGGGILNAGDLTLTDDVIDDNTTQNGALPSNVGDPGGKGGGLDNEGTATLTGVRVENNTTGAGGGGEGSGAIVGGPGGPGAGIYNGGHLTLTDS